MKETSGTLSNTTVDIPADLKRDGMIISNNSDTVMTYRPSGTASANVGIAIGATSAINLPKPLIRGAGTLFCAGTSKAYTFYEF